MKLLLTGASGFLGKNIQPILSQTYAISTLDKCNGNDYVINLSKEIPQINEKFNVVLHVAGKAHHLPTTETAKKEFFNVNYQGTINLCKSLEKSGVPNSFIYVSTVAVYGLDYGVDISEEHPLNGTSPYALSKIKAETFLTQWCNKHNVTLGIIRPSLIAGPNPPGNLEAMINGIKTGKYLSIAGGKAKKSLLMVEDIANLIIPLAEKGGIYNVCDDTHPSFRELEKLVASQLNKKSPFNIPYWVAKMIATVGDILGNKFPLNTSRLNKMTKSLTFSNKKAKDILNWQPKDVLENFKIN